MSWVTWSLFLERDFAIEYLFGNLRTTRQVAPVPLYSSEEPTALWSISRTVSKSSQQCKWINGTTGNRIKYVSFIWAWAVPLNLEKRHVILKVQPRYVPLSVTIGSQQPIQYSGRYHLTFWQLELTSGKLSQLNCEFIAHVQEVRSWSKMYFTHEEDTSQKWRSLYVDYKWA